MVYTRKPAPDVQTSERALLSNLLSGSPRLWQQRIEHFRLRLPLQRVLIRKRREEKTKQLKKNGLYGTWRSLFGPLARLGE